MKRVHRLLNSGWSVALPGKHWPKWIPKQRRKSEQLNRNETASNKAILLVVLVGCLAAVLAVVLPHEPMYQGQSLTYWVEQLSTPGAEQARTALREIGSEAVPFLLNKVRRGDWQRKKLAAWEKLPSWLKEYVPTPETHEDFLLNKVPSALSILGPTAVPQMLAAVQDRDSNVQLAVVRAIVSIGPKAHAAGPALIQLLSHTNCEIRVQAILGLGQLGPRIGPAAQDSVWALTRILGDTNFVGWRSAPASSGWPDPFCLGDLAAEALGQIGPEARLAVVDLTKLLNDSSSCTRRQAAIALWRITNDTNLISRVIAELETAPDAATYRRFLDVLSEMGPAAKPAVPILVKALRNSATLPEHSTGDLPPAVRDAFRRMNTEDAAKAMKVGSRVTLVNSLHKTLSRIDSDSAREADGIQAVIDLGATPQKSSRTQ